MENIKIIFKEQDKVNIDFKEQITFDIPVEHNKLLNLDYDNSGHVGFASEKSLNEVKELLESSKFELDEEITEINKNIENLENDINSNVNVQVETLNKKVDTLEENVNNNIGKQVETLNSSINETKQDLASYKTTNQETLNKKVDVVDGKQLSTNDFTDSLKQKLESLKNYDDTEIKNSIDKKANKTDIPTQTSSLINDSGYITKFVDDLTNYYKKGETYTQEEINNKLSTIPKFKIEVVSELPTTNISSDTIYLKTISGVSPNMYEEYIYVNNAWEKLGTQTVDLSGYAKTEDIPTKVSELENDKNYLTEVPSDYAKKSEIPTKVSQLTNDSGYLTQHQDLSSYAKKSELFSKDYNDLTNKPTIPSKMSELTQDVELGVNEEEIVEIINQNADEVEDVEIANNGNFDENNDNQIPTSLAVNNYLTQRIENKVDKVSGKGLSTNDLTNELLNKLNTLSNYDDTNVQKQINDIKLILTTDDVDFDTLQELVNALKNNVSSIADIFQALNQKVDKIAGKGLSTNDFTTTEKNKLASLSNYDDTAIRNQINNTYTKAETNQLINNAKPNINYQTLVGYENINVPVVVPNSGYVEKIYFNTSLQAEKIKEILDGLTYVQTSFVEDPVYGIVFANDGSPIIFIEKYDSGNYAIIGARDITDPSTAQLIFSSSITNGKFEINIFDISEYSINKEVINDFNGFSIGNENEKAVDLFRIMGTKTQLYELNNDGTINTQKPINVGVSKEEILSIIESEYSKAEGSAF